MTYKDSAIFRIFLPLLVLTVFVAVWQVALSMDKDHKLYLIPNATTVLTEFASNLMLYVTEGLKTAGEAMAGFLIGNAVSFGFAIWMSYSRAVERVVYPYAIALKATPIVALAPIIVAVFGQEMTSKVVCAAVISFFPLIIQAPGALRRVPNEFVDLFHSFGASERQIFFQVRLPFAAPEIFSALKTASSLAVIGALMGEFIGPTGGLGKLLVQALANAIPGQLVAATIVCVIIGILFFSAIHIAQRRIIHWEPQTV
jgi:NitT/TauT family transport system permease protein